VIFWWYSFNWGTQKDLTMPAFSHSMTPPTRFSWMGTYLFLVSCFLRDIFFQPTSSDTGWMFFIGLCLLLRVSKTVGQGTIHLYQNEFLALYPTFLLKTTAKMRITSSLLLYLLRKMGITFFKT